MLKKKAGILSLNVTGNFSGVCASMNNSTGNVCVDFDFIGTGTVISSGREPPFQPTFTCLNVPVGHRSNICFILEKIARHRYLYWSRKIHLPSGTGIDNISDTGTSNISTVSTLPKPANGTSNVTADEAIEIISASNVITLVKLRSILDTGSINLKCQL